MNSRANEINVGKHSWNLFSTGCIILKKTLEEWYSCTRYQPQPSVQAEKNQTNLVWKFENNSKTDYFKNTKSRNTCSFALFPFYADFSQLNLLLRDLKHLTGSRGRPLSASGVGKNICKLGWSEGSCHSLFDGVCLFYALENWRPGIKGMRKSPWRETTSEHLCLREN